MNETDKFALCAEHARLTLAFMSRKGIPAYPENYSICFEYVTGADTTLHQEMEEAIAKGQFDRHTAADLYRKHLSPCNEEHIQSIQKEVQRVLSDLHDHLLTADGETSRFGESLESTRRELTRPVGIEELQRIVDGLREQAEAMESSGARLQANLAGSADEVNRLRSELETARHEASIDPLTGLANRKLFNTTLMDLTGRTREADSLILLMADIDEFKGINDTYGHLLGDRVITFVANALHSGVDGSCLASRYGGEEFAVLLPDTTLAAATTVAETIRNSIEKTRLVRKNSRDPIRTVTISIGVAAFRPGEPVEEFIERADRALYRSKRAGRNRVTREDEAEPSQDESA